MTPGEETDLKVLLKALKPKHNIGDYVFCMVDGLEAMRILNRLSE
jgi:hypothetical protein